MPPRAIQHNSGRGPTSRSKSIPAPSGGWNVRDSIANMPETDAVTLENWIPRPDKIEIRKGFEDHVTGIGSPIDSLMAYRSPTAGKLFAAAGADIYDVTTAGAVGAADVTGLGGDRWQHTMFSAGGGDYLVICNGIDSVREYNGSAWSTPTITGATSANLVHVNVFKNRLYFVEKDTMKFWYLGVNAIAGAATSFDLGSIFSMGGYLVAIGTWTLDSGTGADDLAVFITSEGEVAVYQGTDPNDATRWGLVGVFKTNKPIGRRCMFKLAGDLILLTEGGFLPVSKSLYTDRTAPQISLSAKIDNEVNKQAQLYGSNFGWQGIFFPTQNLVLFNIPIVTSSLVYQYAMDTTTRGWCKFSGFTANCWETLDGELYYGASTSVCKALTGVSDGGNDIDAIAQPAFNYFGTKGRQKNFTMMRPIISLNGKVTASMVMLTDFKDASVAAQQIYDNPTGSEWDVAEWDVAPWGVDAVLQTVWYNANGIGYSGTGKFQFSTKNATEVSISSVDYLFRVGDYI